ncbi:MAG TPA: heme exporter protein CcmD [Nevskiaceae bacterium]|nr:heme exporter protein CcmD [Nevskiaceae bacterium]
MSEGFFHMGGYAFYVWGSFGLAALVYGWNALAWRAQRRDALKSLVEAP